MIEEINMGINAGITTTVNGFKLGLIKFSDKEQMLDVMHVTFSGSLEMIHSTIIAKTSHCRVHYSVMIHATSDKSDFLEMHQIRFSTVFTTKRHVTTINSLVSLQPHYPHYLTPLRCCFCLQSWCNV